MGIFSWNTYQRPQVPVSDTDEIWRTSWIDESKFIRSVNVCCALRFNDVLDAGKLHDALVRLVEKDGWRKLGGRVRLNVRSLVLCLCFNSIRI
jgi:hypothetical protein